MSQREIARQEFAQIKEVERIFRETVKRNIFELAAKNGASKVMSININDGPTRVSSWSDEVDEVVVGCTVNHVIIDDAGNESAVALDDLSTETLVDTFAALEAEIESGQVELTDCTELVK